MATHSSVLAWRIPGMGSLLGCYLWGRTELDMTEVDLATILYDMDGPGLLPSCHGRVPRRPAHPDSSPY